MTVKHILFCISTSCESFFSFLQNVFAKYSNSLFPTKYPQFVSQRCKLTVRLLNMIASTLIADCQTHFLFHFIITGCISFFSFLKNVSYKSIPIPFLRRNIPNLLEQNCALPSTFPLLYMITHILITLNDIMKSSNANLGTENYSNFTGLVYKLTPIILYILGLKLVGGERQ